MRVWMSGCLSTSAQASNEAVDQLKRAYSADPTDESLGLTLERALQKAGDAEGLVELYERRRATTTDSADMLRRGLVNGFGHGKALGLGLLSLAKVPG